MERLSDLPKSDFLQNYNYLTIFIPMYSFIRNLSKLGSEEFCFKQQMLVIVVSPSASRNQWEKSINCQWKFYSQGIKKQKPRCLRANKTRCDAVCGSGPNADFHTP